MVEPETQVSVETQPEEATQKAPEAQTQAEVKTEEAAPEDSESQAPVEALTHETTADSQPVDSAGCTSVVGSCIGVLLTAMAAAVALRKDSE